MTNQAIETIERDGYRLEIFQDDSPDSPMSWGWPVELLRTRSPLEREDLREIINEHGNIWYSQIPTQDRDYHYVIAKKRDWIRAMKKGEKDANYHGWEPTKAGMQKMVDGMAETMKQYYDGDIYGYVISINRGSDCHCDAWETLDSCWGYYGMKDVLQEGKAALNSHIEAEKKAIDFERNGMAL